MIFVLNGQRDVARVRFMMPGRTQNAKVGFIRKLMEKWLIFVLNAIKPKEVSHETKIPGMVYQKDISVYPVFEQC